MCVEKTPYGLYFGWSLIGGSTVFHYLIPSWGFKDNYQHFIFRGLYQTASEWKKLIGKE